MTVTREHLARAIHNSFRASRFRSRRALDLLPLLCLKHLLQYDTGYSSFQSICQLRLFRLGFWSPRPAIWHHTRRAVVVDPSTAGLNVTAGDASEEDPNCQEMSGTDINASEQC